MSSDCEIVEVPMNDDNQAEEYQEDVPQPKPRTKAVSKNGKPLGRPPKPPKSPVLCKNGKPRKQRKPMTEETKEKLRACAAKARAAKQNYKPDDLYTTEEDYELSDDDEVPDQKYTTGGKAVYSKDEYRILKLERQLSKVLSLVKKPRMKTVNIMPAPVNVQAPEPSKPVPIKATQKTTTVSAAAKRALPDFFNF